MGMLREQTVLMFTRTMGLGGTENVVLQLCEILKPVVKKVVVCSCGGVNEARLKAMGITHYTIPDVAGKKPRDMLRTICLIRRIIRDEKVTIIHSHHRMSAFYAELLAPRGVWKLACAHNTFQDKKALTRFAYRRTNVIAVGEMVRRNLVDFFGVPTNQVSIIHNAVKPFDGSIVPDAALATEKAKGHVLIGNIGRLSEQKGMCYFIDAAPEVLKAHPEARFVIVGDGELKQILMDQAAQKQLQNEIIFLGYRSDVQNVMSQLDFVVLSSLWEGFPLTPIEAYSVGKTVIGTAVDGTPEIIRDGVDGCLIEARSAVQVAEKICFLLDNPEKRAELEVEARKRYQDAFSFDKLTQEYIKFYEELVK